MDQREREQGIDQQAAGAFATELVDGTNQFGLPAERAFRTTPILSNVLLIVGELLESLKLKVGKIDRFTSVADLIEHFRVTRD